MMIAALLRPAPVHVADDTGADVRYDYRTII
jgi:hypothetical protein